jgi:glucose/arabinose dehydrogenase
MTRQPTKTAFPAMLLALLLVLCAVQALHAREFGSDRHRFTVSVEADGLKHPWALAFLPDGDILVSEREGRLRIIRNGRLLPGAVGGLPEIRMHGQGGLLDLLPHPGFSSNRLLYFSYAADMDGGWTTHVARARFDGSSLKDVEVLFRAEPASRERVHFGSRLAFDARGFLYISVGDRGEMDRPQDLGDLAGKVVRLHDDGSIPADNPFRDTPGARPEIFSYGHRNPQGMAVHPVTGEVWTHEHGPRGGDEVNILRPGANYGWPIVTLGISYMGFTIGEGLKTQPGMADPLHYWIPSIAPSGMAFSTSDAFSGWKGDLFVGALARRHLVRLRVEKGVVVEEERLLEGLDRRIRDVRVGPAGSLWLLTDHDPGQVLRLDPAE